MLYGPRIQFAAVLAFELAERQLHELRLRAGGVLRQIDLEVLTVTVQLADEFLRLAVGHEPELHALAG